MTRLDPVCAMDKDEGGIDMDEGIDKDEGGIVDIVEKSTEGAAPGKRPCRLSLDMLWCMGTPKPEAIPIKLGMSPSSWVLKPSPKFWLPKSCETDVR